MHQNFVIKTILNSSFRTPRLGHQTRPKLNLQTPNYSPRIGMKLSLNKTEVQPSTRLKVTLNRETQPLEQLCNSSFNKDQKYSQRVPKKCWRSDAQLIKQNTQQINQAHKDTGINVVHPTNLGYIHTTQPSEILLIKHEIT